MEGRVTYGEIRAWFLGSYYSYCKVKLSHQSSWAEGESEVGHAYGELENSFELPIETLILEVIALIISAGRSQEKVQNYHLDAISKLLEEFKLFSILEYLPFNESVEVKDDLMLLGIC